MIRRQPIVGTILAAVAALASTSPVGAADIDEEIRRAAGITPVEYASGWYLRGDVAWNIDGRLGAESIGGGQGEYTDALAFRAGFGYRFNPHFRLEATLEHVLNSTLEGAASNILLNGTELQDNGFGVLVSVGVGDIAGTQRIDADYSADNLMLSAYYDLPKLGSFTPYVGAGIGIYRIRFTGQTLISCFPTAVQSCGYPAGAQGEIITDFVDSSVDDIHYALAFQASLGTSYQINDYLSLDFGYTYLATGSRAGLSYADGAAIDIDGYGVHQIRAGLRYEIW